jgi:hypothetical protein
MLTSGLSKNLKGGDNLENLSKSEEVILKYMMKKYDVRVWLG